MFISRNGRTEVAVYRKCHFAVDMKGLFFVPVEVDSPFCRLNVRAVGRGYF